MSSGFRIIGLEAAKLFSSCIQNESGVVLEKPMRFSRVSSQKHWFPSGSFTSKVMVKRFAGDITVTPPFLHLFPSSFSPFHIDRNGAWRTAILECSFHFTPPL